MESISLLASVLAVKRETIIVLCPYAYAFPIYFFLYLKEVVQNITGTIITLRIIY